VADRILADTGEKAYGALTVGVRAVAEVERLFHVGRSAFRPVPNVDSAVIAIRPRRRDDGEEAAVDGETLRALTRATFGMRRKQMQKILRIAPGYGLEPDQAEAVLDGVGVPPTARPERLEPDTFVALAAALLDLGYPRGGPGPDDPADAGEG
jgi:16S rRNA (adenine1518-N6/adenine1519-N6)-dimethyltransferase